MAQKILNYPAFVKAIDSMFSQSSIYDISTYRQKRGLSKKQNKAKIETLSHKLATLKAEIEKYKAAIKATQKVEEKKSLGLQIKQLISTKQKLVKTYKETKESNSFLLLDKEAKVYACAHCLLKKYLLDACFTLLPQAIHKVDNDNIMIDIDTFVNSQLYQQAQHIKDYVSAYIDEYPLRVKGIRYFVGIHKNIKDFTALLETADDFFDELNKKNQKNSDKIKQSHEGIKLISVFAKENVQAVQLLNKAALEYEGLVMSHCVATYAKSVEDNATTIFSIRNYGDEQTEFEPHATIEYKDGKVKQIKGYKDSIVDIEYIDVTRKFLMQLLEIDNLETLINTNEIPDSEKNNIGILKDKSGKPHDILNSKDCPQGLSYSRLYIQSNRLQSFPFDNISIDTLTVKGPLSASIINRLSQIKNLKSITLKCTTEEETIDLSSLNCKNLTLEFTKPSPVKKIILPPNLREFTLDVESYNLTQIISAPNTIIDTFSFKGTIEEEKIDLSSLYCTQINLEFKKPALVKQLVLPPTLKKLAISGKVYKAIEIFDAPQLEKLRAECNIKNLRDLLKNSNLKELHLTGNHFISEDDLYSPTLEKLELYHGTFYNLKKLDTNKFPNLKKVDFDQSTFPVLEKIILSPTLQTFGGSHSEYPALKSIDGSKMSLKSYGVGKVPLTYNWEDKNINKSRLKDVFIPILETFTMHFSSFPKLEKMLFNPEIEKISFLGTNLETAPIDFNQYPNLTEFQFYFSQLSEGQAFDLSQNHKLKRVISHNETLGQIIPPSSVTTLKVYKRKESQNSTLDLTQYPNVTTLEADFVPSNQECFAQIEDLSLGIHDEFADVTTLDLSLVKHATVKTSSSTNLPNLERIITPESFTNIELDKLCPKLTEIDLTHTKGEVRIDIYDSSDKTETQKISLKTNQISLLKKIKLGRETDLILLPNIDIATLPGDFPIVVELSADTPKLKEQKLKEKYPTLTIKRARVLSPKLIKNKKDKTL